MAVQIVNTYGFNVKRLSILNGIQDPYRGSNMAYQGDQVYVVASSLANAKLVLAAQYGADLGPVTGGTTHVFGGLTTMSGT